MSQVQMIPCDVQGCNQPAKYHVKYSWTKPEDELNLCESDLNAKDERGNQYFRRTAVSIISLEAMPNVQ